MYLCPKIGLNVTPEVIFITQNKERALQALLTTNSVLAASEKAGLAPKTLYRYLHEDAEFKERYEEEAGKLITDATEALQRTFSMAIDTLRNIIDGDGIPPAVKVQACRSILDCQRRNKNAEKRRLNFAGKQRW